MTTGGAGAPDCRSLRREADVLGCLGGHEAVFPQLDDRRPIPSRVNTAVVRGGPTCRAQPSSCARPSGRDTDTADPPCGEHAAAGDT